MKIPDIDRLWVRWFHRSSGMVRGLSKTRRPASVPPGVIKNPDSSRLSLEHKGGLKILHIHRWGASDGFPVVMLHGLNANSLYWTGVASLLENDYSIIAPDLRGHGKTGCPQDKGYLLEAVRADLIAFMERLGLEQVFLVGHSWGGKVACDLACVMPERIAKLVLVDPVPPQGLAPLFRSSNPLVVGSFAPERAIYPNWKSFERGTSLISYIRNAEPWMIKAFQASFSKISDGSVEPILSASGFQSIYEEFLQQKNPLPLSLATMPALLIKAGLSVIFNFQIRQMKREMPHLRSVRLTGEHSLQACNPVGVANLIRDFFRG